MITTAERLLRQGRREGLQEGLQKGLDEGQHTGRIEVMLAILEGRFGELDRRTCGRIRRAKRVDLDRWARALLVAATLDEVFTAEPASVPRRRRPAVGGRRSGGSP